MSLFPHLRASFFLLALAAGAAPAAGPAAYHGDQRLSIDARIDGHPVRLAFDTGAGVAFAVGRATVERLGLTIAHPPPPDPKPGLVNTGATAPVKLELLGRSFPAVTLEVIDWPRFLAWEMDGLVGWPALRRNIVTIRVADLTWSLSDRMPAIDAAIRLPVRPDSTVLVLDAAPAPDRAAVLIDTGDSDGVKLSPARWRAWRAAHPDAPATLNAYYTPGTGLVVAEECWADDLAIGALRLHGVAVQPATISDVTSAPRDYAATLGLAALRRVDLVVDGPANLASLRPRPEPPPPYSHNRLAAVFVPPDLASSELIAHVLPGGPAAAAGVRDGDRLLKIDDLDVTGWQANPALRPGARFWDQPAGTRYRLTLRRGSALVVVSVVLRDLLGPRRSG